MFKNNLQKTTANSMSINDKLFKDTKPEPPKLTQSMPKSEEICSSLLLINVKELLK